MRRLIGWWLVRAFGPRWFDGPWAAEQVRETLAEDRAGYVRYETDVIDEHGSTRWTHYHRPLARS